MKHVVIIGASGRMGNTLVRCLDRGAVPDLTLTGAVDLADKAGQGQDVGTLAGVGNIGVLLSSDLPALLEKGEVFIDFSFHSGIAERAKILQQSGAAWVIGTTGMTPEEMDAIEKASHKIPIVLAPNMSLGVNLLFSLVKQAASALNQKGYDIEVIEHHHRKKLDAPSGTALFLGQAAAEGCGWDLNHVAKHGREGIQEDERPEQEIGFHAIRGGDVVGDHEVQFAAEGEMLTLSHRATSRDTFAIGALRAAAWVAGRQPGLYTMRDVLALSD